MKQLLLRVPDDLHRRLAERSARDNRSVNSLATELLHVSVDTDIGTPRERLRARASALGLLRETPVSPPPLDPAERSRILASTEGIGPVLDQLLSEERDRV